MIVRMPPLMQRYVYLILFAIVLVLPFLMRAAVTGASRSQAQNRLVVITPHNQDIRREFARGFDEWHRHKYGESIELDYRVPGATNDIKRQLETSYAAYRDKTTGKLPEQMPADIHVAWGGGDFFFYAELQPLGILKPMPLDPRLLNEAFPSPELAGVRLYDATTDPRDRPTPRWVGVCLSSFGIVYNPQLFQMLKLPEPTKWEALSKPKLNGWITVADPTHSGSAAVTYMMVIQHGMANAEKDLIRRQTRKAATQPTTQPVDIKTLPEYPKVLARGWREAMAKLVLTAANTRYFTDQAPQVPNEVAHGNAAAGMAIDFYGRSYQDLVGSDRIRYVTPVGATATTPDPVAILHGVSGKQHDLAMHFVEYLLSPEGQRLWIVKVGEPGGPKDRALWRPPIRLDAYVNRTGWVDGNIDPFADAGDFNLRSEWMATLSESRLIWTAAWIDSREELKAAYKRILQLRTKGNRTRSLQLLARLPVEYEDVLKMRQDRKAIETTGNVDEWRARQRVHWAGIFRDHYQNMERRAVKVGKSERKNLGKKKK